MNKVQKYTKGFVTSKDGTKIGYRQMGTGFGIILHGGAKVSSMREIWAESEQGKGSTLQYSN